MCICREVRVKSSGGCSVLDDIFVCFTFFVPSLFRCPEGKRGYGSECRDINECIEEKPCENGGTCINFEDERSYVCMCPSSFTGRNCEATALPSGIITTSADFVIALLVCILILLGKFSILFELNFFVSRGPLGVVLCEEDKILSKLNLRGKAHSARQENFSFACTVKAHVAKAVVSSCVVPQC